MDQWLIPVLSLVVGIAGGLIGAFVGVRVALGRLEERMKVAESEIVLLRHAKHETAGILTRHSLRLHFLDKQDEP